MQHLALERDGTHDVRRRLLSRHFGLDVVEVLAEIAAPGAVLLVVGKPLTASVWPVLARTTAGGLSVNRSVGSCVGADPANLNPAKTIVAVERARVAFSRSAPETSPRWVLWLDRPELEGQAAWALAMAGLAGPGVMR